MDKQQEIQDLKFYSEFESLDNEVDEHYKATIYIGMVINTGAVISILSMKDKTQILDWSLLSDHHSRSI